MENNPYGYDKNRQWPIPLQQGYNTYNPGMYANQQPGAPQALNVQQMRAPKTQAKTTAPARMPKARALALVNQFKKSLVLLSLATFASFSGLIAYQQIQTTSSQNASTSTTSASQQKNKNFLKQQGENNLGTSTPTATATANQPTATATTSSGSASGSDTPVSAGPVSSSHTS